MPTQDRASKFKKNRKLQVKKIKNKNSKIKIKIYKKKMIFTANLKYLIFFLKLLENKENLNIRLNFSL